MENQRTEYIQAKEYERTENRQSQRNGYYERSFTTRVGTLELKVPENHVMAIFHRISVRTLSTKRKSPHGFNVGNVCIRRFNS